MIVLVLLVVLGLYRGWFALSGPRADKGSNNVNFNLPMDGERRQVGEFIGPLKKPNDNPRRTVT